MRRNSLDPVCASVFGVANGKGFSVQTGLSSIRFMVSARTLEGREECV